MAEQTNRDRLREITDSIEQGIQELFAFDCFAEYLCVMIRYNRYSVNKQMFSHKANFLFYILVVSLIMLLLSLFNSVMII